RRCGSARAWRRARRGRTAWQLLVGAQADDGAQRQALAVDEVLMALRLGHVLAAQPPEAFVAKALRIARGEAQRAELAAVVAFVAHAESTGGEGADEDARVHHAVGALEVEPAGFRLLGRTQATHEAV